MTVDLTEARRLEAAATPIAGYPGYSVTSDGQVISTSNWRGYGTRVLTAFPDRDGYLRVRLHDSNGKRVAARVHRLVAAAYLPPQPSASHEIRHLNGNQKDNRAINLAWGTPRENAADRERHGRTARGARNGMVIHPEVVMHGSQNGNARLTEDQVRWIRAEASRGRTSVDIGHEIDMHPNAVAKIIRRGGWRHVE